MRLVCPNCAAQYEVDASLLPAEGTEVQCSACGTVWFQPGADSAAPDRPPEQPPRGSPPAPSIDAPDRQPAAQVGSAAAERPKPGDVPEPGKPEAAASEPSAPEQTPDAPSLDPSVAEVLREEAEYEATQRAREQSPLETQQELGLFGPVADEASQSQGGASSLPDIDDISSTLEPIAAGRTGQSGLPQTQKARKRGFLTGLAVPVGLAAVLAGLYLGAPVLAGAVPALGGLLTSFVDFVDTARRAVAGLLGSAL